MNIAYARLGNGNWKVEAWLFVNETEMVHQTSIHPDRRVASWDAVRGIAKLVNIQH